jgi:Tol biopolymer transport system component/DNA-binding winged helix-turn-helix (wHTH) protein
MMGTKSFVYSFGDFEVREREFSVLKAGEVLQVEPKAFRALLFLLRNPQKLIPKEELVHAVWGDTAVADGSLTRCIWLLRRLLGDDFNDPRYIVTVATVGYRFICPVEASEDASAIQKASPPHAGQNSGISDATVTPVGSSPGARPIASLKKSSRSLFWLWPVAAAVAMVLAWLLRPELPPPLAAGTTPLTHDGAQKLFPQNTRLPIVTDGSKIYFQEITPTNVWPLMQVATEGGETAKIDVPLPPYDLSDISSDGHELLFDTFPGADGLPFLHELSLPAMEPRRVGNQAIAYSSATLSPDGRVLYYATKSGIFAADADGSHSRKLFTAPWEPFWLRVSPGGRILRFSVAQQNGTSLWEAHTDGTGLRQLFPGLSNGDSLCCGNWTPDGKYFVFESTRGGISSLWAKRDAADLFHKISREPVQLTHGELSAECPLPSKDGKRIFFIGILRRGEVMRYSLKTHEMTSFLPGFSAVWLSFTKDGQRMAYVSFPGGSIWQSKVDGTDRHQLTFPPMAADIPRWSPDGSQIAFMGGPPGRPPQVYLVPAGGGVPEQITFGDGEGGDPTWSPDGTSIAYAGPCSSKPTKCPLHLFNLKTREVTAVPGSEGLFSPRWSPDGQYLAAFRVGGGGLMLYDFNSQNWQQLTKLNLGYQNWTPDGKCLYVSSSDEKHNPVYRVCLSDRKVEQVADMAQAGPLAIAGGNWWTGLAPDGSILALRDTGTEEIYALDVKLP